MQTSEKAIITAIARVDPPYVTSCFAEEVCDKSGVDIDFLNIVVKLSGYAIKFISSTSYTDGYKSLSNDSIDLYASVNEFEVAAVKNLTMNGVGETDQLAIIARPTRYRVTNKLLMLSILQPPVWGFLVCIGCFVFAFRLLSDSYYQTIMKERANRYDKPFWRRSITQSWLLFLSLFLGCFGNLLTLCFATGDEKLRYPFDSFPDLVDKLQKKKCTLLSPYSFDELDFVSSSLNHTDYELRQKLEQAYQRNQIVYEPDRDAIGDAILSSNRCVVGLDYFDLYYFYKSAYCNQLEMVTYDKYLPVTHFGYLSRRNFRLKQIDAVINSMSLRALRDRIWKRYLDDDMFNNLRDPMSLASTCGIRQESLIVPVSVEHLTEVFTAFVLGCFGAAVAYIVEVCRTNQTKDMMEG